LDDKGSRGELEKAETTVACIIWSKEKQEKRSKKKKRTQKGKKTIQDRKTTKTRKKQKLEKNQENKVKN